MHIARLNATSQRESTHKGALSVQSADKWTWTWVHSHTVCPGSGCHREMNVRAWSLTHHSYFCFFFVFHFASTTAVNSSSKNDRLTDRAEHKRRQKIFAFLNRSHGDTVIIHDSRIMEFCIIFVLCAACRPIDGQNVKGKLEVDEDFRVNILQQLRCARECDS